MPISGINFSWVLLLLVHVGFISNIKDCIEQDLTKSISLFSLWLLMDDSHFWISFFESFQFPVHLFSKRSHHLFLSPYCCLLIKLSSLVVSRFSKLSVFNNHILALISSPRFVLKFFFLLWLSLHSFDYLSLFALLVHFDVSLGLIHDHLSTSSFTLFSCFVIYRLLILGFKTSWA